MLSYEPDGCFVAAIKGQPVGHVFTVNYGRLGWIGFLIVKSGFRRQGVGTELTKHAIAHLLNHEAQTVRLEAVPEIAELYRRLGFVDEYDSLRFVRDSAKVESLPSPHVHSIKKGEITEISEFDAEYFGANRRRVLQTLYENNPQSCLISTSANKVTGYIMSRERESGYTIGPWVCCPASRGVERKLLAKCLRIIGRDEKVYVGVPAVNEVAVETLVNFGFRQYSKSIRMFLGERLHTERVEGVFAIGGPMKG